MENQTLQHPVLNPRDTAGASAMVAPVPAAAQVKHREHLRTEGEKKFDRLTYTTIGYIVNALLSVVAVYAVERTPGGQRRMDSAVEWVNKKIPNMSPDTVKMIATKSFFLTGGFLVMAPMKWLEDAKVKLVKKWDAKIYGDAVDTDPSILKSHRELEATPKQSWSSILGSRVLALIPFYVLMGALWDNTSALARVTNPELRGIGKNAAEAMKKADPAGYAKIAEKGIYFDNPITAASRYIGEKIAQLRGKTEIVEQIQHTRTAFPGTMTHPKFKEGPSTNHDPNHTALPYYFISEAITSGVVAWGVYALTRVLGPLVGKKTVAPAQLPPEKTVSEVAPAIPHTALDHVRNVGGYGHATVEKALAHGVTIEPFHSTNSSEDIGGYYDAAVNKVYLNAARPTDHQAAILVHECQHACNLFDKAVLDKQTAAKHGLDHYTQNFLRDEARAHAAGFVYANEANSQQELHTPAMQSLFKDTAYAGADVQAFTRYTQAAYAHLEQGALGYKEKAQESYAAHTAASKTHAPAEKPQPQIHAAGLEHHTQQAQSVSLHSV